MMIPNEFVEVWTVYNCDTNTNDSTFSDSAVGGFLGTSCFVGIFSKKSSFFNLSRCLKLF